MKPTILIVCSTLTVAHAAAPWVVEDKVAAVAQPFPPSDVRLLDGPFKAAMDLNARYLLQLEPDRLMAPVRREAGLPPKAKVYGGWEQQGVASHSLGHYLSAAAMQYAATGDDRFKERAAYLVKEMAECQKANGNGYAAGIPGGKKALDEVSRGDIRSQGFDLNGLWVPWYTIHKLLAGLRDVYVLTGNPQAKQVLVDFGAYCWSVVDDLDDAQMQKVLACEHGGMNEISADIHALTGDERFLAMARKFYHKAVLEPLSRREDRLQGLHANTQVPKLIGCARLYEVTGEESWETTSGFFWDRVVHHYSYANGGNSFNEHFGPPDHLSGTLHDTTETCNSYNMLKLTNHLFRSEPRAELMDFHEKVILNHILAHQHPGTGMYVYKGFLDPATRKNFSTPDDSFWCCVGTGFENHTKYTESAYFHSADALWVNLFLPSKLDWRDKGVVLEQRTGFPDDGKVNLKLALKNPTRFTLRVRIPAWSGADVPVSVGGAVNLTGKPGSYLDIDREWKDGDEVRFELPMTLRMEAMPDDASQVAFFRGPTLLCAVHDKQDVPPAFVGDAAQVLASFKRESSAYIADAAGDWGKVRLVPLYQIADERYSVYLRRLSADQWRKESERLRAEAERRRKIEAATVDFFQPGEMQPERDHSFTGENIRAGRHQDRPWRDATSGGWMGFEMKSDPAAAMDLICTWWGDDNGGRAFEITCDGRTIGNVELKRPAPGRFVDQAFPIDPAITKGRDKVRVELRAKPGNTAGGIFGARMVRRAAMPAE